MNTELEQYEQYEGNGLSILLPCSFIVRSEPPNFYADDRNINESIIVETTKEVSLVKAWKQHISNPFPLGLPKNVHIIRSKKMALPHHGWESIIQREGGRGPSYITWGLFFEHIKSKVATHVEILSWSQFPCVQEKWIRVIQSIRVKGQ